MFLLKNLFRYIALYFLSPIRNGIIYDMRMELQEKIISLPLAYFTEQKKGDLTSRMTSDLVEIEWSIMGVIEMIFKDPINIFIFLITLIVINLEAPSVCSYLISCCRNTNWIHWEELKAIFTTRAIKNG